MIRNYSDFRRTAGQWWANMFLQGRITNPGQGDDTMDVISMVPADGSCPEASIPLTRLEQFGDVVCPPADCHAIAWRKSDDGVIMSLNYPPTRPTDGKSGDRGLYCDVAGSQIRLFGRKSATPGQIDIRRTDSNDPNIDSVISLLADGTMQMRTAAGAIVQVAPNGSITIAAASGRDVTVNNGSKPVALDGDVVTQSPAMKTWMDLVTSFTMGIVPPLVGTSIGTVTGSAGHFRG